MTDELIRKLIDWVETASPKLWAILVKQVYVNSMNNLVGFVVCFVLALLCYKLMRQLKTKAEENPYNDYEMEIILSWVMVIFGSILGIIFLVGALNMIINPEFYAIKWLITSLGG